MKVVPPYFGEMGLKVHYHAPAVYALDVPYVAAIEPGDEALYPGAETHIVVPRYQGRRPGGRHWNNAWWAEERGRDPIRLTPESPKRRFIPEPYEPQGVGPVDVVVCPRKMRYGATKNWGGWPELTARLSAEGLDVHAAGLRESSYDVPATQAAWDYSRELDATIEAMRTAAVVVATDAGLAHLAVLCGSPLVMITHADGLVAPGPVLDENGQVCEEAYWPVKMERYTSANHTAAPLDVVHHGWHDPDKVFDRTMEAVS